MLLARVAESMYWTGRYVERAECVARILAEHSNLHVDLPRGFEVGWEPLLSLAGSEEDFWAAHDAATEDDVVGFLIHGRRNPGSMVASLARARENLRTTRSVVPREAWEILDGLWRQATENAEAGVDRRTRFRYLRDIVSQSQCLAGLLAGTMNHDDAYAFLTMGRHLERADMTTRVLTVRAENLAPEATGTPRAFDNVQWMGALRSVGAHQMFRRCVGPQVRPSSAVRFLLQEPSFPRSVTHCLDQISRHLKSLPHPDGPLDAASEALLWVHEAPLPTPATKVGKPAADVLVRVVERTQAALAIVHDEITATYFAARADLAVVGPDATGAYRWSLDPAPRRVPATPASRATPASHTVAEDPSHGAITGSAASRTAPAPSAQRQPA